MINYSEDIALLENATVQASSTLSDFSVSKAFNGSKATTGIGDTNIWVSKTKGTEWIKVSFIQSRKIGKYTITNRKTYQNASPVDWELYGSNDDSSWTLLDSRNNITDWASGETKEFIFDNNNFYKYYKFVFLKCNGNLYYEIAEIEMMEVLNYNKYLIQNKTNVLSTIDGSGLVNLGAVAPAEELFNSDGFDDITLINGVALEPESKILTWTDNMDATKLSLDCGIPPTNLLNEDHKLLMYTDDTDISSATLNYNCDSYRPIDKTDEQFKILMYKEELKLSGR